MKHFFRKLLLGKISTQHKPAINPIQKRILNIKAIWNNEHQDDNGIEKIVRLLLAISQLVFPGAYIKYFFYKKAFHYQDLMMDIYILCKVAFPFFIVYHHLQQYSLLVAIMVYFLIETMLYIPTLIFASDMFAQPRSYKRSMLLLFFNYIEIVVAFAVLYSMGSQMNKPFVHWFDPIYFSIVTSSTIGFGEYYPITFFAKILVSIQAFFYLTFVLLFLNFFSNKLKSKGYFEPKDNEE